MRYPSSHEIQLTVVSSTVKHLWFSIGWYFQSFVLVFSPVEVKFKFILKWRQAGLSRSQMRNLSNSLKKKKIRIQRGRLRMKLSYSEELHSDIKL